MLVTVRVQLGKGQGGLALVFCRAREVRKDDADHNGVNFAGLALGIERFLSRTSVSHRQQT